MSKKPPLKLVKKPPSLGEVTNFWNSCPLALKFLPEKECLEGKPTFRKNSQKVLEEPKCPWWVNSAQHNYCFWRYIRDRSDSNGVMRELAQAELAALFGWSNTKTHFTLKEAMMELSEALHLHSAEGFMDDLEEGDFVDLQNLEKYLEQAVKTE